MKKITKHRLMIPLLALALGLFIAYGSSNVFAVDFGFHQINFLGASYDAGTNATTFTYEAIAAAGFGFDFWELELNPDCFGAGDIIDVSESYQYLGPDPVTGLYGIKFDQPYAPGESRTVWFRLSGDLSTNAVRVVLRMAGCSYYWREIEGPECGGQPTPPPPEGEGKSPGYWGTQLGKYLGYQHGKLKEPNVESYAAQYGYTAEEAYAIFYYDGNDPVGKLHRQLLAAKLSTAAGYLWNTDELLEQGQYMVAHPGEFTFQELEDAKDLFESLHD